MAASTKTMRAITTRAMQRLKILQPGQVPDANEIAIVNDALNGMMHGWRKKGVDTEHTTLALGGTFPLDEAFEEGVSALLAVHMSPEYGKQVDAMTAHDARECWTDLLAEYVVMVTSASFDSVLTNLPSQRHLIGTG